MIEITDKAAFGEAIANALTAVETNADIHPWQKARCVKAIAKAARRIESAGTWMDLSDERLLVWSDSNEIYEATDAHCQCRAFTQGQLCWHRAAKRLIERYMALTADTHPAYIGEKN